jgi:hypothetical protein
MAILGRDESDEVTQHPVGVLGKTMDPSLLKKKKPAKAPPTASSPLNLAAKAKEIGSMGITESRFGMTPEPGTTPGTVPTSLGLAVQAGKKMGRKPNV